MVDGTVWQMQMQMAAQQPAAQRPARPGARPGPSPRALVLEPRCRPHGYST